LQKIFVGDVQGCGDELDALVTRAEQTFGADFELWSVGDLINRGPKNLLALRRMRELSEAGRGFLVLGNHEVGLLRIWLGLWQFAPKHTHAEVLEANADEGWMDWLRRQPLASAGEIGDAKFAMVHAAVHPDWSLDELLEMARRVEARLSSSDLEEVRALLIDNEPTSDTSLAEDRDTLGRLTRCRSVDEAQNWSKAVPEGAARAWHEAWSEHRHRYGVVYGHWSMQGLHVAKGLRGLDTGCVHHGRGRDGYLTAWLPTARDAEENDVSAVDPFDLPDDRFWQIPALARYYD
jgi:bis(5'-nucleosyl)-tetraphosphatase (symmetrical)